MITDLLVRASYIFAAALFVLALKWMSAPTTARRGVVAGEMGMLLAVVGTLIRHEVVDYQLIIIAFVVGVAIVIIDRIFPKARPYTPSPAALGIALTIPAYTSFSMFLGAFIVWILERKAPKWNNTYTIPIASGCIAGESIMGVILAALMAFGIMK